MTRVLLLSDDTFALMRVALEQTPDGRLVLDRFDTPVKLPSDRETLAIVRAARAGADPPARVAAVVGARDAAREAVEDTRAAVEALLFHLSEAGVAPSVLQRWFGYSQARIFQLLSKHNAAVAKC